MIKKYIGAEKLKAVIKVHIKKLKEWVKDLIKRRKANDDEIIKLARHFYELGRKGGSK